MSENENELSAPFDVDLNLWLNGAAWGDVIGNIEDQSDLIDLVNTTKGDIEQDISNLADTVTANYNDLSGQISDLSDTVTSNYNELSGNISDLSDTVSANYTDLDDKITVAKGDLSDHIADKSNPHEVTATQVGLGDCDNTSDLNKPISTATQTALDGKVDKLTDKPTTGTYTKVAITNEGLVSSGDTLTADDIPSLTLSKISDVTATAEEVNILDGATLTTTELNYVDGVTSSIQTQINGKQATITSENMLSSDLVDDTEHTHKFATASQLTQITTNANDIITINGKIPSSATTTNQLADKDFVNSSIATNTANFIGTFESVSDLQAYSGTVTNNDYSFVINGVITNNGNDWATFNDLDAYDKTLLTNFDYAWVINGANFDLYRFDIIEQTWSLRVSNTQKASVTLNTAYNRYKATVTNNVVSWGFEYTLNNSSFTSVQWAAINSGANTVNIAQISTNTNDIAEINTIIGGYGDIVTYNASAFATSIQGGKADSAIQTVKVNGSALTPDSSKAVDVTVPTKISDLTDNTSTYPVDKADTLTNLTATISELNILDGVTATATELNVLDGITASTTELNYVDGVTSAIQTQLNAKQTTANLVTSVSSLSTDSQYPSAKLFYDTCGDIETLINAL